MEDERLGRPRATTWPTPVGQTCTHVRRAKGGTASVHPIGGRELRALRRLKREAPASVYVFVSERLAPLSVAGYQRMVARAGEAAGSPSSFTATCCGTPAATSLRTMARTRERSSTTLGTSRSTQPYGTRLWRRIVSRGFGRTKRRRARGGGDSGTLTKAPAAAAESARGISKNEVCSASAPRRYKRDGFQRVAQFCPQLRCRHRSGETIPLCWESSGAEGVSFPL